MDLATEPERTADETYQKIVNTPKGIFIGNLLCGSSHFKC